jgi:hypothetical protein
MENRRTVKREHDEVLDDADSERKRTKPGASILPDGRLKLEDGSKDIEPSVFNILN